ncbi:HEL266Cp [Eremothecium sinecaudum]|uniref:HEL266Cp n=1 Tax=Eremothecium sinecaudum TaxID=45286 RepID=A0A120K2B4_9SACH|nr:HEL266Cp [Eremothecium sinecaudum]AMD21015.1 HEL266Cp [Eremothecium sinecaudum]
MKMSAETLVAPTLSSSTNLSLNAEPPKPDVNPETTIFIGNLASDCSEQDLMQVFGKDVEVEIPSNKTGKFYKQRYAFVKFADKIDFEAIKEKYDNTVVKDRGICVKQALTKEQRDQHKQMQQQKRMAANGKGSTARKGKKFPRGQAVPAPPQRENIPLEQMQRSSDTLYVNNIPYYSTKEELAEFFGTTPELIVLPMRRMRDTLSNRFFYSKSMNRGIAFITFDNLTGEDAIVKKMELFQGKVLKDREITVDVAATKPETDENSKSASDGAQAVSSSEDAIKDEEI